MTASYTAYPKVHLANAEGWTACGRRASEDAQAIGKWTRPIVRGSTVPEEVTCAVCREKAGLPKLRRRPA